MKPMLIELTEKQMEELRPVFEEYREMAKESGQGIVVAQVREQTMVVGIYHHEACNAMFDALEAHGYKIGRRPSPKR